MSNDKMNLEEWIDDYDALCSDTSTHSLAQATLQSIRESEIRILEVMGCSGLCLKGWNPIEKVEDNMPCPRCTALKELKEGSE